MKNSILVTGGAGYIGSHTTLSLLEAGFNVIVIDNLSNSSIESLKRIKKICGREPKFIEGDICNKGLLDNIFSTHEISAVMHFAGLKAVGESTEKPLEYYKNNVAGSLVLLQSMAQAGIQKLVFSSSATVYGNPQSTPISENTPTASPTNPYGRSKLILEEILHDLSKSNPNLGIAVLRYFNPIGGHESGLIGEDPNGIPNNLVPYISQVAVGRRPALTVFGADYPTVDGTGVRDYIHVMDLAEGHIKALDFLNSNSGIHTWNLGTGTGYSVLQVISAFEKASGRSIPYHISSRRQGDIAECWSDASKAATELNWIARRDIDAMMHDAWNWQSKNPKGYRS
ncbi:UDP-glucose 4-epimerase GalE [Pseudomonas nicosulfuronedens]